MKKVLITGATGYLGSNLIKRLIDEEFDIYCYVRDKKKLRYLSSVETCVTLIDKSEEIPSDVELIIHTATNYGRNEESDSDVYYSNVISPLKVIENVKDKCIFINIDTILPKLTNIYALSKNHFYEALTLNKHKLKAIVNIKFDFMYGPNESENKFTQYLIKQFKETKRIPLTNGSQIRNFIFIDDLVEALVIIVKNYRDNIDLDEVNEFEISTEDYLTIKEFVNTLYSLTNSKAILGFGDVPYRETELMVTELQNEKIVQLGWKPKTGIKEGLIKCLNGVKDEI